MIWMNCLNRIESGFEMRLRQPDERNALQHLIHLSNDIIGMAKDPNSPRWQLIDYTPLQRSSRGISQA